MNDPRWGKDERTLLSEVHEAVCGNEKTGNKGLLKRVEALETSDKITTQKLILWGGIITGVGLAIQFAKTLFK